MRQPLPTKSKATCKFPDATEIVVEVEADSESQLKVSYLDEGVLQRLWVPKDFIAKSDV